AVDEEVVEGLQAPKLVGTARDRAARQDERDPRVSLADREVTLVNDGEPHASSGLTVTRPRGVRCAQRILDSNTCATTSCLSKHTRHWRGRVESAQARRCAEPVSEARGRSQGFSGWAARSRKAERPLAQYRIRVSQRSGCVDVDPAGRGDPTEHGF